jgi:hypothetical protein
MEKENKTTYLILLRNGYDRSKHPKQFNFRRMTLEEAKKLERGNKVWFEANDGTARQIKVNGKVRRWKREPDRIEVPCKYGLYECYTFTNRDLERLLIVIETV